MLTAGQLSAKACNCFCRELLQVLTLSEDPLFKSEVLVALVSLGGELRVEATFGQVLPTCSPEVAPQHCMVSPKGRSDCELIVEATASSPGFGGRQLRVMCGVRPQVVLELCKLDELLLVANRIEVGFT